MLKTYKNKGVSLIELMVAVGLGLILILSMLAFYSISSQNVIDFQRANHDQQQIRKMMNLLETDIENIGGFESCTTTDKRKPFTYGLASNNHRLPQDIISLGNNLQRQQIVFVHPIIEEYQHTALGMLDFDKDLNLKSYTPTLIKNLACGSALSSIYVGSTILEMIPMDNIITTDNKYAQSANNIKAFVALSSVQSRRDNNSDITKIDSNHTPTLNDATVMFLSDEGNNENIPFGQNTVDIFLGFSPEGKNQIHIPNSVITKKEEFKTGGWINPFTSRTNNDLLVDKDTNKTPTNQKALLSQTIHIDAEGKAIETYPLKPELIEQVRAIKFQFTFGAHDGVPERKLTRIIRFKNTHLMKPDDNSK